MTDLNIPGYKILEHLGQGGMCSVYLAEQLSFGRKVALKVMTPELAEKEHYGHRFLREARISASLSHPNIVAVYDTGQAQGNYFLAMEYLAGGNLRQRLNRGISLPESLEIVQSIAEAIDYAANKGVVHRDIKPGNIMFREDGSVAVVDFGIARDLTTETMVTQIGTVLGTPHYMSPEQSLGEQIDYRSDLYSLGIILFELLSGRVPFSSDTPAAVGIQHVSQAVPRLPEDLVLFQPLVDKMLEKAPEDRFQSGAALSEELQLLAEGLTPGLQTTVLLTQEEIPPAGSSVARSLKTSRKSTRSKSFTIKSRQARARTRRRWQLAAGSAFIVVLVATWYGLSQGVGRAPAPSVDQALAGEHGRSPVATPAQEAPLPTVATESDKNPLRDRTDDLALRQIDLANEALDEGTLERAMEHIGMARSLEPSEQVVEGALAGVLARASEVQEDRVVQRKLSDQLARQQARGQLYAPPEENAYKTLAALTQAGLPEAELTRLLDKVDAQAEAAIRKQLDRGDLGGAEGELALWKAVARPDSTRASETRLRSLRQDRQQRAQQLNALRREAQSLEPPAAEDDNHKLFELYQDILRLQPGDKTSRLGLARAVEREMATAQQALSAGELDKARNSLAIIAGATDKHAGLASLERELNRLMEQEQRSAALVDEARDTLALALRLGGGLDRDPGDGSERATLFVSALRDLGKVAQLNPEYRELEPALLEVTESYQQFFTAGLAEDDLAIAEAYVETLTAAGPWSGDANVMLEVMREQLDQARAQKRRDFSSF